VNSNVSLNKIRKLIDDKGYKQTFLAQKLSIMPNTFYCKLLGRSKFSNIELGIMADVLQISVNEFFE